MRILKTAALALALGASGSAMAATDGLVGTTSTGTFTASINIPPPNVSQVQVLGLDDFNFGSVANTQVTNPTPILQYFCINRSDVGDVVISFEQPNGSTPTLRGQIGSSGGNIPLDVEITDPAGLVLRYFNLNAGQAYVLGQSGAGCTSGSVNPVAHSLYLAPKTVPPSGAATPYSGNFSSTFTLIASPL